MKLVKLVYTPRPVTAERIEKGLDDLASIMVKLGDKGAKCMPIYERLERELVLMKSGEDKMAAIRERAKRSKGRTPRRPS